MGIPRMGPPKYMDEACFLYLILEGLDLVAELEYGKPRVVGQSRPPRS